jgi:glucose-1-phosphate adenylyltransferase
MTADKEDRITKFSEKPTEPDSNLASMGIYIFKWKAFREALLEDHGDKKSTHDFGNDLIPKMLAKQQKIFVYRFEGYWRDVGTVDSYYESQMDLMDDVESINVFTKDARVFSNSNIYPPQYIGPEANIGKALISNGCTVYGDVDHSILGSGVVIGEGSVIKDSIILPNAIIGRNCTINKSIVNEGVVVDDRTEIGDADGKIVVYGTSKLSV